MDVKRAAELAELPLDEFLALNPQHNRPVIAGADEYAILLPIDKAEIFAAKLDLIDQPLVSWQAYRMKAGRDVAAGRDSLRHVDRDAALGQRHRPACARCRPVTRCSCRCSSRRAEAAESLENAVFTTVPAGRTFFYTVRRGDTLTRHRRPLRRHDAGPAALESPAPATACAPAASCG